MQHIDEVLALLDLTPSGGGSFRGEHPDTALQRTFGGQVLAQALSAMYRTVPEARLAHSLKGYFLRPGSTRHPIDYLVTPTRDGGSFSHRHVEASQAGTTIFTMSASCKSAEPGLEHARTPAKPPLPPEECPRLAEVLGSRSRRTGEVWEREWAALDTRYVGSSNMEHGDGARLQLWLRSKGALPDDPRVHQMVLAYASDLTLLAVSTLPHPGAFGSPSLQMATIDHTLWFHRHIRADEWVLYDQSSPNSANALGLSFGQLYSADGVLGASAAQEGLIRVTDDRPRTGLV